MTINPAYPKIGRVFGNAEVVEMLEQWTEAARKGTISYVALIAMVPPRHALFDYRGSVEMEDCAPEVIDQLKAMIEEMISKRQLPAPDDSLDASHVSYNCARQSLSFDFLIFLVGAEMERRREKAPGPLRVGFWFGDNGSRGLESVYRQTMFVNVVRPSLPLLGAVEDTVAVRGRNRGYRLREIVEASRRGETVPKFRPSDRAAAEVASWFLEEERPITITLREQGDNWPHRNSNLDAWLRFGDHLRQQGETVVFVRDTAKAGDPLPGHSTCPAASASLEARCALYQRAKTNLCVSNGPVTLLQFMEAPWLMLSQHDDSSEYFPETSKWWEECGLVPGDQFPWSRPDQREVFSKDSLDEIMEAWHDYSRVL